MNVPLVLEMDPETIFPPQFGDGRAVDRVITIIDAITQPVGRAEFEAVLCL